SRFTCPARAARSGARPEAGPARAFRRRLAARATAGGPPVVRRTEVAAPRLERPPEEQRVAEADVDRAVAAGGEPGEDPAGAVADYGQVRLDPGHDRLDERVLPEARPLAPVARVQAGGRDHSDERGQFARGNR